MYIFLSWFTSEERDLLRASLLQHARRLARGPVLSFLNLATFLGGSTGDSCSTASKLGCHTTSLPPPAERRRYVRGLTQVLAAVVGVVRGARR